MQLYYAPTSPFVRKVMVCAHLLGVAGSIEQLAAAAHPVRRDKRIGSFNPLAQVPSAQTDDGLFLYDSRVICEYLDTTHGGGLFPAAGPARWQALTRQALGDGLLNAAVLTRYERVARPPELHWQPWEDGQLEKVRDALAEMERQAAALAVEGCDIGEITFGCALGYLDFRFPELDWRGGHPQLAAWFARFDAQPAMAATRPHD